MTISRSRSYIATNPRFALTSAGTPRLQRGQMEMVYQSLCPHSTVRSLEDLADRCFAQNYEETYKRPVAQKDARLFLRMSILYHLRRMEERGMIREILERL